MLKSVGKEIVIILLLSVAIVLVLGILLYDYIPINKVVPTREAYTTPDNIRNEITEDIAASEKVEVTYEVTDSDLNVYQQSSTYTGGKANPFADPEEDTPKSSGTSNNNGGSNNSGSNSDNNNNDSTNNESENDSQTDKNSTGTFFDNEGIK